MKVVDLSTYPNNMGLAEVVYFHLKDQILDGEIGVGERLIETDISNLLGVSRTPVRHALEKLAENKLVVRKSRQGTFVSEVDPKDLADLLEVRMVIEKLSVKLAVQHLERDGAAALKKAFADLRANVKSGSETQICVDSYFFLLKTIAEIGKNSILKKQLAEQGSLYRRFICFFYQKNTPKKALDQQIQALEQMCAGILQKSFEKSAKHLSENFDIIEQNLIKRGTNEKQ